MSNNESLSQSEIDALLKTIKEGGNEAIKEIEAQKEQYKVYDFNRPEKYSRENLRSLETIAMTYAKTVSQTFSARLRHSVSVEFTNVEQIPFITEYADKMSKDYYGFCVVDLGHPQMHEIVIELDLALILAIHNRWWGGEMPKGELRDRRPITDIEQVTLAKILKTIIFPDLEEVFKNVAEIKPKYIKYESDPALLRVTSPTDMAALVIFKLECNGWSTTMKLVIPFQSIEGVIDRLTTEKVRETKYTKKGKSYRQQIAKGIGKVEEDVHVLIGETTLSLGELSKLEIGDYLKLDDKINVPSKIFAAGVHKFNGFIGKNRNQKAFRFFDFEISEEELEQQLVEGQVTESDSEEETEIKPSEEREGHGEGTDTNNIN